MKGTKCQHKCAATALTEAVVLSLPGPELPLTGVRIRMCFLMMLSWNVLYIF